MIPLSPISSNLLTLTVAGSLALLAVLCLAPVQGTSLPGVPQRSISRPHCQSRGLCHFYTHCLESEFPCGKDGFVMSYGRERCRVISRLRVTGVHYMARMWARDTEVCFQAKLLTLLNKYPQRNPDPQTCLSWEEDAIAELNSCYAQTNLKEELFKLSNEDITKLIELFRVGGSYYNSTVDSGLVSVYREKNTQHADSLQSRATTTVQRRAVLCVWANKYQHQGEDFDPTPEDIVNVVSNKLDRNHPENFHYAGPDQFEDMDTPSGLCFGTNNVNANTNDYHLVTWFLPPDSSREVITSTDIMHITPRGISINAVVFELTSVGNNLHYERQVTRCGDGIRQISEDCDFGSNYPGCTLDCQVRSGHDCTTEKLAPSTCWMEECGDGLRTLGEECDDGNMIDGDGCNSSCKIECSTHTCTSLYNATSDCSMLDVVQAPLVVPAKLLSTGNAAKQSQSSVSGESMKRTVEPASSGCGSIQFSFWWLVGLLSVSALTLR